MKTKFSTDNQGRVTINYDDAWADERVERCFSCPDNGGYVVELLSDGGAQQVCDGLSSTGSTLSSPSREGLLNVIRREYKKMRREEKNV